MKPKIRIKRRVFKGWMDLKSELPKKTTELSVMRWGAERLWDHKRSERRVKITVEWEDE